LSGLFCPSCSKQRTEYPFSLYFGEPLIRNGAWFQRQDIDFADIARLVEDSLSWLVTAHLQKDSGPSLELLVTDRAALETLIYQLHDYEHDQSWIPHWKSQIEYIEGVLCNEEWPDQSLAILRNRIDFLKWRIDEARQMQAHGVGWHQHSQLLRCKRMLAVWKRGDVWFESDEVNWEILEPSGDGSRWPQILAYNDEVGKLVQERRDDSRLKILHDHKPDNIYRGKSGFNGYLVFKFDRGRIALLDSAFLGNALYSMPSEKWEEMSRLSKTELLDSHPDVRRIVHPKSGWPEKLRTHLVDWGIVTL